jgi:multicomponent K+:H+ antiporter subunit D
MSKVGIYVLLRLSLLFFGEEPGISGGFGSPILFFGGLATIVFGIIGVLASQALGRLAGFSVLVSSGTLLAIIGLTQVDITAAALFYLVSSTLAISAFFMLIELVEREQSAISNVLAVTKEAFGEGDEEEEDEEIIGVAIPGSIAILGISFVACSILLAGLPPLSGFIAKFAILTAILNPEGFGQGGAISSASWWLIALLILSGLSALIAMVRAGIRTFWAPAVALVPRVLLIEIVPVVMLLFMTLALTVQAGPIMHFMEATAISLHEPRSYIEGVMKAPPAAAPWQMETEE